MRTLHQPVIKCEIGTDQAPTAIIQQMAEALDDEALALFHRAAAFEEEEFMLGREIEERYTEINRLLLKLEAVQSDRDGLLERIERIRTEAVAMRGGSIDTAEARVSPGLEVAAQKELGGG